MVSDLSWTATPSTESSLDTGAGKCSLALIQSLGYIPEMNQLQSQGLIKWSLGLDQAGFFFKSITPKTQWSGFYKSNAVPDKLGHWGHQASAVHVWVHLAFQYSATFPFLVIYIKWKLHTLSFASSGPSLTLLYSSLPPSYFVFCSHTEINSVSKLPRDVEVAVRTKPTAVFLFI